MPLRPLLAALFWLCLQHSLIICLLHNRRTRQTLWGAKQMLTQKHVAKRYMIAKK